MSSCVWNWVSWFELTSCAACAWATAHCIVVCACVWGVSYPSVLKTFLEGKQRQHLFRMALCLYTEMKYFYRSISLNSPMKTTKKLEPVNAQSGFSEAKPTEKGAEQSTSAGADHGSGNPIGEHYSWAERVWREKDWIAVSVRGVQMCARTAHVLRGTD